MQKVKTNMAMSSRPLSQMKSSTGKASVTPFFKDVCSTKDPLKSAMCRFTWTSKSMYLISDEFILLG